MIAFDFAYSRPNTPSEAVALYETAAAQGQHALYYAGGTEIITFSRMGQMAADAIIDIKDLPECQVLGIDGEEIVIGAAVTLNQLADSDIFPLFGQTAQAIADRTARNKITVGGNVGSRRLMYREMALPFLLCDSKVKLFGPQGARLLPFTDVFHHALNLKPGELITQFYIPRSFVANTFVHLKKTKQSSVNYPLVTVLALEDGDRIRMAFSGVCAFPFRDERLEELVSNRARPLCERVKQVIDQFPHEVLHDLEGSEDYRKFVLQLTLEEILKQMGWAV